MRCRTIKGDGEGVPEAGVEPEDGGVLKMSEWLKGGINSLSNADSGLDKKSSENGPLDFWRSLVTLSKAVFLGWWELGMKAYFRWGFREIGRRDIEFRHFFQRNL